MANWSSGGWIRIAADSVLRMTRVPAARYELQLTPSHGWLEFKRLSTSYSWLHPTADSNSGGSIRLRADSSCGWLRVVADSILTLTRVSAAGLEMHLIYSLIYQVNLRTCSAKYIFFSCFLPPDFSYHWFRLCLLLQDHWSSLEKLEKTWRSFETLAATDSSCSGWFELRRLIRDLRPIDYVQNFDPDGPW